MKAQSTEFEIVYFTKDNGRIPVKEFLKGLPAKDFDKMDGCIETLKQVGASLGMPHCRPITGHHGLYELRSQMAGNIQRIFYFTLHVSQTGQTKAVLLHGFTKKTQKTPANEIEKAEKNRAAYLKQKGVSNADQR